MHPRRSLAGIVRRTALVTLLGMPAIARAGGPVTEPAIAFDAASAVAANGPIPTTNALATCGSNTDSYLAELLHVFPTDAKVTKHWPEIEPGHLLLLSGTVTDSSLGSGDLPFDHPFGSDMNFDVMPDAPYAALNQFAADGTEVGPPEAQHVELEEGLLPHRADRPPGPPTGQAWEEMSETNRGNLLPGFVPQPDDHVALMGHWIIDCGHTSYETEIHPVTFLAVARTEGDATVARVFFNPYYVTQLYSPDPSVPGRVEDRSRFTDPAVQTFPSYLVSDVVRLLQQTKTHLGGGVLLDSEHESPPAWRVCAPLGTSGHRLRVEGHFALRLGVHLKLKRDRRAGCVTVTTTLGLDYVAQDPPLRLCALPWDWLNAQAAAEAGVPDLDIRARVESFLPPSVWPLVDNTPDATCADGLIGWMPRSFSHRVTDPDRVFPLIGTLSVAWR